MSNKQPQSNNNSGKASASPATRGDAVDLASHKKGDARAGEHIGLERDGGTTIIRDEVVAKVAGVATQAIPGVYELVPFDASQSVTQLANRVFGNTMRDLGIHVEVGRSQTAVDVRIIVEYGTEIVDVCDKIRAGIRDSVERTTGLECVEVNIEVIDVWFPDDDSSPVRPPGTREPLH